MRRDRKLFLVACLAPALLLYTGLVVAPALAALRFSVERWDGLGTPAWAGLANFRRLLTDRADFGAALSHNVYLTLVPGVIVLALALYFAWCIHRRVPGAPLFRTAFFFPNVISSVAVALLWVLLYSTTNVGLLNAVRRSVFHIATPYPFTESSNLLTSLVPMIVWSATGFYMLLFLAAMEGVPPEVYEAAELDGARGVGLFGRITLPLIWDVFTIGVLYLVIGGLKIFDVVWVMENGRPSGATHTLSTLMYSRVFEDYNVGYGTAIAVMLFVLVLTVTLVARRLMRTERVTT